MDVAVKQSEPDNSASLAERVYCKMLNPLGNTTKGEVFSSYLCPIDAFTSLGNICELFK